MTSFDLPAAPAPHPSVWITPSYRIPDSEVTHLARRVRRQLALHRGPGPLIVSIDGRSGAGKSALAQRLLERLEQPDAAASPAPAPTVTLFHLEDLYPGWDGLLEGVEIFAGMLARLRAGRDAPWRAWDWRRDRPEDAERTLACGTDVLIAEGVGATVPGWRGQLPDVGVWLYLEEPVRKLRALRRDGEIYRGHWDRWAAQEERLFGL